MNYQIHALKNGQCQVRDYITFHDGGEETRTYFLYVWLITGGPSPVLVETGVTDVEGFNAGVEKYIPGGVIQKESEQTVNLFRSAGVSPQDISHVFVTHFHGDHYDSFHLFPNAVLVANREGFNVVRDRLAPSVAKTIRRRGPECLRLVGDEEVLPGITTFHLGVHSDCSQGISVQTRLGRVILPGDLIYTYRNLEEEYAPGWTDVDAWRSALAKLKTKGDIILPAHDPEVLQRWPGGVLG